MSGPHVDLPEADITIAGAVAHLERVSRAFHERFSAKVKSEDGLAPNLDAYVQFRAEAYSLLTHYVDHGLQDAFKWLLLMNGAAPQRSRIPLQDNPFHWGLLAMTAAARSARTSAKRWKPFMSRNKLRDLGSSMKLAHAEGVTVSGLEDFITNQRKRQHHEALSQKLKAVARGSPKLKLAHAAAPRKRRARGRRMRQR